VLHINSPHARFHIHRHRGNTYRPPTPRSPTHPGPLHPPRPPTPCTSPPMHTPTQPSLVPRCMKKKKKTERSAWYPLFVHVQAVPLPSPYHSLSYARNNNTEKYLVKYTIPMCSYTMQNHHLQVGDTSAFPKWMRGTNTNCKNSNSYCVPAMSVISHTNTSLPYTCAVLPPVVCPSGHSKPTLLRAHGFVERTRLHVDVMTVVIQ